MYMESGQQLYLLSLSLCVCVCVCVCVGRWGLNENSKKIKILVQLIYLSYCFSNTVIIILLIKLLISQAFNFFRIWIEV